jgi:hypothetical protein
VAIGFIDKRTSGPAALLGAESESGVRERERESRERVRRVWSIYLPSGCFGEGGAAR